MDFLLDVARTHLKLLFGRGVFKSYSQFGEDAVVWSLIDKYFYRTLRQKRGVYLDIGSYHPVTISNTYALYRKGWKGVVVDPNPRLPKLFALMRPRDTFIAAGVGATSGTLTYHLFENGAYNTFDKNAVETLAAKGKKPVATLERPLVPLEKIIKESKLDSIDLCNIDVEGMDLEVLRSYSWTVRPKIFIIEDHAFAIDEPKQSETYRFFETLGYALKASAGYSCIYIDRGALSA